MAFDSDSDPDFDWLSQQAAEDSRHHSSQPPHRLPLAFPDLPDLNMTSLYYNVPNQHKCPSTDRNGQLFYRKSPPIDDLPLHATPRNQHPKTRATRLKWHDALQDTGTLVFYGTFRSGGVNPPGPGWRRGRPSSPFGLRCAKAAGAARPRTECTGHRRRKGVGDRQGLPTLQRGKRRRVHRKGRKETATPRVRRQNGAHTELPANGGPSEDSGKVLVALKSTSTLGWRCGGGCAWSGSRITFTGGIRAKCY